MIKAGALFFLFCARVSLAAEASIGLVPGIDVPTRQEAKQPGIFYAADVQVEIEHGGTREHYSEIMPIGSTTADVLSKKHHVKYGKICADEYGVLSVDGIGNYSEGRYWIVSVNGDYANTNAHTILKSGDNVKWKYVSVESKKR
jgi:hypothetical protein